MQSSSPVLDFLSSNFILAGGKVEPQPEVFLLNTTLPFSLPNFENQDLGALPIPLLVVCCQWQPHEPRVFQTA